MIVVLWKCSWFPFLIAYNYFSFCSNVMIYCLSYSGIIIFHGEVKVISPLSVWGHFGIGCRFLYHKTRVDDRKFGYNVTFFLELLPCHSNIWDIRQRKQSGTFLLKYLSNDTSHHGVGIKITPVILKFSKYSKIKFFTIF